MEDITNDEFDLAMIDILKKIPSIKLLLYPGIYEIIAETFNNEIIERAKEMREEKSQLSM